MRAASRPPQLADSSAARIVAAAAMPKCTSSRRQMRSPGCRLPAKMVLSAVAAPWKTSAGEDHAEHRDQHRLHHREGDQGPRRQPDQPQHGEVPPLALDMAAQAGGEGDQVAERAAAGDQPEGDAEIAVQQTASARCRPRRCGPRRPRSLSRASIAADVVDRAGIEAEPREHCGPRPAARPPAQPRSPTAKPSRQSSVAVRRSSGASRAVGRRDRRVGDAGDGERQALRLEAAVALPRDLGGEPVARGRAEAVGEPACRARPHPRPAARCRAEQRVARPGRQQRDAGEGAAARHPPCAAG